MYYTVLNFLLTQVRILPANPANERESNEEDTKRMNRQRPPFGMRSFKAEGCAKLPWVWGLAIFECAKGAKSHSSISRFFLKAFILKTELESRMDADRRGFSAGYSKRRIHPKDEPSDPGNSFLIRVNPCESVVLFSLVFLRVVRAFTPSIPALRAGWRGGVSLPGGNACTRLRSSR